MHRSCRADRLADRRREIGDQPEPVHGRVLRTDGCGGLPLWRVGVFVRTLHPEIYGRNFIWKPGAEVELGTVDFTYPGVAGFSHQPADHRFPAGAGGSGRVDDPASERFPIIDELRAEGVTDYVALPLPFVGGTVNASSWTTKQPAVSPMNSWRRCAAS
jgi:hypothetical protein